MMDLRYVGATTRRPPEERSTSFVLPRPSTLPKLQNRRDPLRRVHSTEPVLGEKMVRMVADLRGSAT